MSDFTVVEKEGHPATIVELAILNFTGEREIADMTDKEITELANERTTQLFQVASLCMAMLRMDKETMCEKIKADPETWNMFFGMLDSALEQVRCLMNFVDACHARMVVAGATLANAGWPDGPDDSEPLPEASNSTRWPSPSLPRISRGVGSASRVERTRPPTIDPYQGNFAPGFGRGLFLDRLRPAPFPLRFARN